LANIELLEEEAGVITAGVLGNGEKVRETVGFKKVLSLFNGAGMGSQMDGVMGTRWGLLNAFTEYADHHVRARSDENRFVSSQWGVGADLKQRALSALMPA
jgi:hypothetical protein